MVLIFWLLLVPLRPATLPLSTLLLPTLLLPTLLLRALSSGDSLQPTLPLPPTLFPYSTPYSIKPILPLTKTPLTKTPLPKTSLPKSPPPKTFKTSAKILRAAPVKALRPLLKPLVFLN